MSGIGDQPRIVSIDLTHLVMAALAADGAGAASDTLGAANGGAASASIPS